MMSAHPRDVLRFCPRCGAGDFAAQQDNSLRCGACSFRWYYNAAAAVDVILENARGEILVTRRTRDPAAGMLDLPGGFVAPDESIDTAARREVREELGLTLGALTWMGSFPNRYEWGGLLYHAVDIIFVATIGAHEQIVAADDVSDAHFVDPVRLDLADVGLASTRAALAHYRDEWRPSRAGKL